LNTFVKTNLFPAMVLFKDEACFIQEGFSTATTAEVNPNAASVHCHKQHSVVNVWAGNVTDFLIGPYLSP
jgi:hypothetical protein